MIRRLRFLVPLFAIVGAALAGAAPPKSTPLPGNSVYQLSLPLKVQDGRTVDWRTLRGKPVLVSMFYTSCQYICPLIVDSGKAIERELAPDQQRRLSILLISMDPARDTPAALNEVVAQRKLDSHRWTLGSPPANKVRSVAGVVGIRYRRLADGEFNHTSALVLLDGEGRILARTETVGSKPDPDFVAAVRKAVGS